MAKERRNKRRADEPLTAEQKAEKAARKRARRAAAAPAADAPAEGAAAEDGIDRRLARIEKAVSAQAQVSQQLLRKLDELLEAAPGETPAPVGGAAESSEPDPGIQP